MMPDNGADRTVARGAAPGRSVSGHNGLPMGTRLAEFEIEGLVGEGGFGIVYLAYDISLERRIALKEYMPAALAARVGGERVAVRSEHHAGTFEAGLKSFINEARLLARFDHPSLVKVYRFWEANGTAYMAMPYYRGRTLKQALAGLPGRPDEAWLTGLLRPLLQALSVLHSGQCLHRDIAPDNILLLEDDERPLLLDFGAARRVIGDMTQALTVILKPGYAPLEQYADVPGVKQGPWTDIYALAAVIHYALRGTTPPPSAGRMLADNYEPLAISGAPGCSPGFLAAVDAALAVRPEARPQSVAAFARALGIGEAGLAVPAAGGDALAPALMPSTRPAADETTVVLPHGRSAGATQPPAAGASSRPAPAGAPAASGRLPLSAVAGVCAALLAVLGVIWWWMSPPSQTEAPTPASSASAPPLEPSLAAAVSPPAPSAESEAEPEPEPESEPEAPALAATPVQPPAAQFLPDYEARQELRRIAALADPALAVDVALTSRTARIERDHLEFTVTSGIDGYAYVFLVDTQGEYLQLFPNGLQRENRVRAGVPLELPGPNWPMVAGPPAGTNQFLVLVSPVAREFGEAGLIDDAVFAHFPPEAQARAAGERTATHSPFAGRTTCQPRPGCGQDFGAALFEIEVVAAKP